MVRKPTDPDPDELEGEEPEGSGAEDEEPEGDEGDEKELDAQVQEMMQEFIAIPEVKVLIGEIARDAAKRAADVVRNEAFNKVQKNFDAQFKALSDQFAEIRESIGLSPDARELAEFQLNKEGLLEPAAVQKAKADLQKREMAVQEREKEIENRDAESRKEALERYRKGTIAEFKLGKVGHLIHGESEDEIDDSVVEARKALNDIQRDYIKELKGKGWNPPAEELAEGDDAVATAGEPTPGALRSRFNYGPKQGMVSTQQ